MKARFPLLTVLGLALSVPVVYADTTTTISGTHTVPHANVSEFGNYRPFKIDADTLFSAPTDSQPITVTGSVDLADLPGNSTVFVGLIAKDRYDAWVTAEYDPEDTTGDFFGFLETAYVGFSTSQNGRVGIGQRTGGEILQSYAANDIGTEFDGFTASFRGSDFTVEYGTDSATQSYVDHDNYLTASTIATDFSNGAYAFVGAWFDKEGAAPVIDVTYSQIPEPASLALLGLGGGMMLLRRRVRG